ncbi:MAG: hypothetical protein KGI54_07835 [Pseudomonadota bacterium]|nr:hypothetical protein [Pseudomonadota bacterium]
MIELLNPVYVLLQGILLGTVFFGGLWWTVRRIVSLKRVSFWFLGSLFLRSCIVLSGFYFMFGDNKAKLILGLIGFIIARLILIRATGTVNLLVQKAGDAS